ncbi:sulfatase [Brachybacterium sp. ACRRE]|uniref:sulfatase family protein n=1 Tax=Brachybacterium sp. ACRRE TaxID=2918184 RepID=UPI001EF29727|nr:sulfatase [Brachybacterium sp. ACRRE]MCG7310799.1 sulfatase [Brachybacterium sp. ACRRE]
MTTPRPNILLILSDDHASHAISAYGSVVTSTPHIDAIAERGRRVDACFCTNAVCTPSRASILTGMHSHRNGVTTLHSSFDNSLPSFAKQLQAAGYRTGIVGKWHLGEGEGHDPEGFDHWEVLRGQGEYHDPQLLSPDGVEKVEGYVTDVLTDRAMSWVDSLEGDEPWCLLVYHKAPHRNWQPDEAHAGRHALSLPLPATFGDDYSTRSSAAHMAAMRVADHLTLDDLKVEPPQDLDVDQLARWKYQRFMEDYLDCVAGIDDSVGRMQRWLETRGDLEDTLLMYSSDQGFFLGDHGWFDKRFIYEESMRMPLLVSWPRRIVPGPPMTQLVTNVDFARTLLEAAGADPHEDMQGLSFLPQLYGSSAPTQDAVYYRYYENDDRESHVLAHCGIRTESFKLIYFYGDGQGHPGSSDRRFVPEWELYDLRTDPHELHNVAHDPGYAEVREHLKRRLADLQDEIGETPHPTQHRPA